MSAYGTVTRSAPAGRRPPKPSHQTKSFMKNPVTRTRVTRGPFQVGIDAAPRALLTELQVRTLSARDDAHGKPASAGGDRPPQCDRGPPER